MLWHLGGGRLRRERLGLWRRWSWVDVDEFHLLMVVNIQFQLLGGCLLLVFSRLVIKLLKETNVYGD